MTFTDSDGQTDELLRLWSLITELSDELNRNRHLAVSLYTETGNIKNQAIHSQSGFVLRKYNLDKPPEQYSAELERMNKTISAENQGLAHDNKQLNTLIKEYEQALEVVMSDFRNIAQDVQSRELSLIRHYEQQLLGKEEEYSTRDLARSTAISESLSRMSSALRSTLRTVCGEPVLEDPAEASTSQDTAELEVAEREPWANPVISQYEHALEREIELVRLERENEELKRLAGLLPIPSYTRARHFGSDSDGYHDAHETSMVRHEEGVKSGIELEHGLADALRYASEGTEDQRMDLH